MVWFRIAVLMRDSMWDRVECPILRLRNDYIAACESETSVIILESASSSRAKAMTSLARPLPASEGAVYPALMAFPALTVDTCVDCSLPPGPICAAEPPSLVEEAVKPNYPIWPVFTPPVLWF